MEMKIPSFFVIGAGKSGTTSLYEYLRTHPHVLMSPVKETNFFALMDEVIPDPKNDPDQLFNYPWSITNWRDYHLLFKKFDSTKHQAIGEVSPMYLYSEKAALNIKKYAPNAKLIVILRQPADRLYSRYMHLVRENRAPGDLTQALDRNSIWWRRNDLVKEGFYGTHLARYFDLFNQDQLQVFLYEELMANPEKVMEQIFAFIGVNPSFKLGTHEVHNPSGIVVNKQLDRLIGQQSLPARWIKSIAPDLASALRSHPPIKRVINRVRAMNLHKPAPPTALINNITSEIYAADIQLLQKLIQKDLTKWMPC